MEIERSGNRWKVFTVALGCRFPANIPIGLKFSGDQLLGFTTEQEAELQRERIMTSASLSFNAKKQRGVKAKRMEEMRRKMAEAMRRG